MRLVLASLEGPHRDRAHPAHPPPSGVLALLSDLVWAHAVTANGLEHVRATASDDGVDLYLFLRAVSDAAALDQARALLDGARASLRVHGYSTAALRR
ncbi:MULTISPECIES: hypothetical protein [Streptomyces]|uniref:hypothetical protein n=1 Tax=Streptomyces TaxID=1883 RepID=UPI00278BE484|nr:hypothetical protein [Streptomyces hydrogenans]